MTIGERIKKIRVFRKMTMDDLGGALGFEGKNMSVRISQYETGARIPGDDMIQKLADALHCNYKAISDYSLGAAEDIIEKSGQNKSEKHNTEDKTQSSVCFNDFFILNYSPIGII